jgi:hypothetical protein
MRSKPRGLVKALPSLQAPAFWVESAIVATNHASRRVYL